MFVMSPRTLSLTNSLVGVSSFPKDKLELVNTTSELPDGRRLMTFEDGENSYVSQAAVFHQFHCLVRQVRCTPLHMY